MYDKKNDEVVRKMVSKTNFPFEIVDFNDRSEELREK